MVSSEDMRLLAMLIEDEIKKEFSVAFLSGNLKNSIKIEKGNGNGYNVIIPAELYDIGEWKKTGVKVYKQGSYASMVDKDGGFSGTHKDYVNRCINKAITRWKDLKRDEYMEIRRV
jgi:hypothetical protein